MAIDPQDPHSAFIKHTNSSLTPLPLAIALTQTPDQSPRVEPVGPLTPLLDAYRGRLLPQASAGFGLPEIYEAFACALNRPVPFTEQEAAVVSDWLGRCGPFAPDAFQAALDSVINRLGEGRALSQILAAMAAPTKGGAK